MALNTGVMVAIGIFMGVSIGAMAEFMAVKADDGMFIGGPFLRPKFAISGRPH